MGSSTGMIPAAGWRDILQGYRCSAVKKAKQMAVGYVIYRTTMQIHYIDVVIYHGGKSGEMHQQILGIALCMRKLIQVFGNNMA